MPNPHIARRPSRLGLRLAITACAVVIGCGDDGIPPRYNVSGKLTRKGQPLSKGTINFVPVSAMNGRAATAEIQPDGTYSLTTQNPGDGAMVGDYKVVVTLAEVDDSKVERLPGGMPRLDQAKRVKVKQVIPASYSDPGKTALTAKVEPRSNSFDFNLEQ